MRILDLSQVTDSSQIKIKKGTFQLLQDASYEALQAIVIAAIGSSYDPAKIYIMYGCKNAGTGNSYNISAGAIFYNGEIYQVDATSFSTSGSQVGVFSIVISQYTNNADPVTFTDGVVRNVHNIRKIKISGGISGSGLANFADASKFSFAVPAQLNLSAVNAEISGEYPNLKITVPSAQNRFPALYAGSILVGDVSGGADFTASFTDLGTANYYVMGTMVSNPGSVSPFDDTTTEWTIRGRTSTGFILHVQERPGSFSQNISFEYVLFAK